MILTWSNTAKTTNTSSLHGLYVPITKKSSVKSLVAKILHVGCRKAISIRLCINNVKVKPILAKLVSLNETEFRMLGSSLVKSSEYCKVTITKIDLRYSVLTCKIDFDNVISLERNDFRKAGFV